MRSLSKRHPCRNAMERKTPAGIKIAAIPMGKAWRGDSWTWQVFGIRTDALKSEVTVCGGWVRWSDRFWREPCETPVECLEDPAGSWFWNIWKVLKKYNIYNVERQQLAVTGENSKITKYELTPNTWAPRHHEVRRLEVDGFRPTTQTPIFREKPHVGIFRCRNKLTMQEI